MGYQQSYHPEGVLVKNLNAKRNIVSAIMQALNAHKTASVTIAIMESPT